MQHLHMQLVYKARPSKQQEEKSKLELIREKDGAQNKMNGIFSDVAPNHQQQTGR